MTHTTFMQRCQTEWRRLNPTYVKADDGVRSAVLAACRETVPGYFAPLRFVGWLVTQGWRQRPAETKP